MVGKYDIEFIEAEAPITDPVTKFGGQPVWLERPEWPLSKELGRQMLFVCQIALDPEIFGVSPGRMTYLFITRESEDEWVDGTYDPDSGENAVIVQPGGTNDAKTVAESKGPSLYKFVERPWLGGHRTVRVLRKARTWRRPGIRGRRRKGRVERSGIRCL